MTNIIEVENKIICLRDQQVILDADVAELYGVETKRVNEAVSNNPEKFPKGYVFLLTSQEKVEVVENFDHLYKLRFSPSNPKAFTEKGLYMVVGGLRAPRPSGRNFRPWWRIDENIAGERDLPGRGPGTARAHAWRSRPLPP